MNTEYKIGQTVESLVDAQGLVKGQQYSVADVSIRGAAFNGMFVVYTLQSELAGSPLLQIHNGSLNLRAVR